MPYRPTDKGTMEFSGKIAEWMQEFQKWYLQDCGSGSPIALLTYVQYLTLFYANHAKGKWQDVLQDIPKAKVLDSYVTKTAEGKINVDVYATLDFLAEQLKAEDRDEWSAHCRKEVARLLKIQFSH